MVTSWKLPNTCVGNSIPDSTLITRKPLAGVIHVQPSRSSSYSVYMPDLLTVSTSMPSSPVYPS